MFPGCDSLTNIKPLENWDVSNGTNFAYMFSGLISLKDIKILEKWNICDNANYKNIFKECYNLDKNQLKYWK